MELPNPQAGGAPRNGDSGALVASKVISAQRAILLRISMLNTNVGVRYLQLFDAAALPADTAVPKLSIPVAAGAFVNLDLGKYGKFFGLGIVACNSSTAATKTIGAADSLIESTYVAGP